MPGGSSRVQTREWRSCDALLREINECLLERLHCIMDCRLDLVVKSSLSRRALLRLLLLPYCRCTVYRLVHSLLLLHLWLLVMRRCISEAVTHFCCSSHPCKIASAATALENANFTTFSCSGKPAALASLTFARNGSMNRRYLCVSDPLVSSCSKVALGADGRYEVGIDHGFKTFRVAGEA